MRDVVIIGAGPAGLHAAYRLASGGLDVEVVEARDHVGDHAICSGVISEEAFERFTLPTPSVLNTIHSIQAVSPAGQKMEHRTTAPLALVVDKGGFNQDLASIACGAGAEISLGKRVVAVEAQEHQVAVHLRADHGRNEKIRARLVVIASGVACRLNRLVGLAQPREFLRAAQADLCFGTDGAARPTEIYVGRLVAPGGFAWKIPLGPGRIRLGVMTTAEPKPYFNALLSRLLPESDRHNIRVWYKLIGQAPRGKCVRDRILAIGEAAGHVKTSTGGGIYYGLLSAQFAAEVILRAFHLGRFNSQTLGDFERYWRAAFGSELLIGYFARKMAKLFSDQHIERIFQIVNSSGLLSRLKGTLRFDWHHRALVTTIHSLLMPRHRC